MTVMPVGINDLANDSHKSAIPSELKTRRTRLKLSRREVADALGFDQSTLQRWEMDAESEHHRRIPADNYRRLIAFYDERDRQLGGIVPRGTNGGPVRGPGPGAHEEPGSLPRQLRMMALDFEREALASGADDRFLRYVRSSFSDPNFTALFGGGPDESPMTAEEAIDEMKAHINELRAILKRRLERFAEDSGKLAPGRDR